MPRCLLSIASFFYRQGQRATNEFHRFERRLRTCDFTEKRNIDFILIIGVPVCCVVGMMVGSAIISSSSGASLTGVTALAVTSGAIVAPVASYSISRGMCSAFCSCPHSAADELAVLPHEAEAPLPMEMPATIPPPFPHNTETASA